MSSTLLVRVAFTFAFAGAALVPERAFAQPPEASAPSRAAQGVAVVAIGAAHDAAAPLARAVAGNPSLKASSVDEAKTNVLLGDAAPPSAPKELTELAELRAGVKGDDAASRQLLIAIAKRLGVRGLLVVDATPSARLFLAESGEMDAARYAPDADASPPTWNAAVRSVARAVGVTVQVQPSPTPVATAPQRVVILTPLMREGPKLENRPPTARKFYESPWFWGALGAAAFAAGAVYFATRDSTSDTIHLQLQVPH